MKQINTKKKALIISKALKLTSIIGVGIIAGFILNFLYNNLYLVSLKYSEVVELQHNKRIEIVNIANFNKILEEIQNKSTTTDLGAINNPFN